MRDWYACSIRYGKEKNQAYVMDLFWNPDLKVWKDNHRLDVYSSYKVYSDEDRRMREDYLCQRNDVIAFKELPKVYK